MRTNDFMTNLRTAVLGMTIFLLAVGLSFGQSVNLTAGPTATTLPDGSTVPMWGYTCGTTSGATCVPLNANAKAPTGTTPWSPIVITVAPGPLTINLTNNLSFAAGTGTNAIPTSLVIVGQLGGGLGTPGGSTASPDHTNAQPVTWPIAGDAPGAPLTGVGTPPPQGNRVRSFSTEVAASATTALCWGPSCTPATPALRPGTYLLESGTHPSIQGPMGLYGILVVTTAPATGARGIAYSTPLVNYDADVPLLLSEIDSAQNAAVDLAVHTAGFLETNVWSRLSGQPSGCGNPLNADGTPNPTFNTCYPPAVNYDPRYYLVNGVPFDRNNAGISAFPTTPGTITSGTILVRLVNAGLRMHVPSIVGALTGGNSAATPPVPPASGFALIAEDGNPLPGVPRVQSEVFMAAGKTYDVMVNAPAAAAALPLFDRQLSLSTNNRRDGGMQAYIKVNGGAPPTLSTVTATPLSYVYVSGRTLTVSDPAKGVIANNPGLYGIKVTVPPAGTLVLNPDGTFTYTGSGSSDSFTYCSPDGFNCFTVNLTACTGTGCVGGAPTAHNDAYPSSIASRLQIASPGVLGNDTDPQGHPLCASHTSVTSCPTTGQTFGATGGTVTLNPDGSFVATPTTPPTGTTAATVSFQYFAVNSQGTPSTLPATVTVTFSGGSGLAVKVLDGNDKTTVISDYRWIIEEDRTFYIDPNCTTNPPPTGCPTFGTTRQVPTFGTNFHTSYMPLVATGCTGQLSCESGQTMLDPAGTGTHVPAVCDVGNGVCRPDTSGNGFAAVDPGQVHLDPTKRYYISVLPGDAANPFENTYSGPPDCSTAGIAAGKCGHGMGGAPIAAGQTAVNILTQQTPFPPAKLSVFVFEDDFPLNGEQDGGGGIDVLSPNEGGLGQFQITLFDDAGGSGDATGQPTYDMFNQPLSNSLAGSIDPATGLDACPVSKNSRNPSDPTSTGITGMIVTCPKYESDGKTLSPIAGQAVVANLYPGRYGVVATPGADRIARGEEWLQTNTLDGQKAHDSFLRIGEPSFFQEYGPAGYHVSIGFANPKIINSRKAGVCGGTDPNIAGNCTPGNTLQGRVTTERMSRTPDERLYSSGSNDSFAFTQCYVSFGDPDGEDFAFTKCNGDGTFTLTGLPDGDWRITVFDQWNDMLVDGLSTPVRLGSATSLCPGSGSSQRSCNMGDIAINQWQANIYTSTFFDQDGNGVRGPNEPGLTLVSTNIRFRDGSFSNFNNTDLSGNAGFNEVFPLFSWYVIETDSTRYKNTGTHVVYDAGGPADDSPFCGQTGYPPCHCSGPAASGFPPCEQSAIAGNLANTVEQVPLPIATGTTPSLRVPGAFYCANADCTDAPTPLAAGGTGGSTGRVDPPWVVSEGWQGFSGQNSFIEFGKTPYVAGENGGIRGHVVYASTRPFDDPSLLLQLSWEPLVPHVTINLYQEGTAPDGSQSLTLVDTTQTSSFDDWAQGFRSDHVPNMNCPGQGRDTGIAADIFFFTLFNQPQWLDFYNSQHGGPTITALPDNSQFKCYDGMHNWNQVQPAPYDGMYQFPSIIGRNPTTGAPTGTGTAVNPAGGSRAGTNCTICSANPTDGTPMLPAGKYVVEVVVPPGYELVKEEDKNILIGDNYIAPATVEIPGLGGAIYILPDQAAVGATYDANNAQNSTTDLGVVPRHEGDTGSVEQFWPCVGQMRVVPDFISLFPGSAEVAPFAGATRPLCDRKEVTLNDQTSALAKFYIFTSTHAAAHFTGVITDDFTSEFDPFSPQFGEKFSPANLPVSIKDWTGTEIARVYSDQWGSYDGLTYSTWEVNPPNPTGYAPTMMVTCMNDEGPIIDTRPTIVNSAGQTVTNPTFGQLITDPLYQEGYSQFCYEIPFMPGQTQYMDTPVTPTSAFAGAGYNNVDCAYPGGTTAAPGIPVIREVDGDGVGPWVSAAGHTLTITALGDQDVNNYGYTGPAATTVPFNQKKVTRHYGFGSTRGAGTVTIGGVAATVTAWSDSQIRVTVPNNVPQCAVQQQQQYGGPTGNGNNAASCGELVITTGNGMKSIDTVTVTIGGKTPTHVPASGSIQSAIDAAAPGDMIIVDPTCTTIANGSPATCSSTALNATTPTQSATKAAHNEILLMWKPVRLQGVGAASSIINGNTHPAGKLEPWRRQVNCLFGLTISGSPIHTSDGATHPFDPSGTFTCPGTGWTHFVPTANNPQVDRLPLEATVGWDAGLNGNLAELLQEPSLMGALEGAGITVLSKGVNFPSNPFDPTLLAGFPTGTALLTGSNQDCGTGSGNGNNANKFPSNFQCNPSSIDGLTITNSSQGGGGIFVHGWGHNIEIANNRVQNNSGTLAGGINVGQGEYPPGYLQGSATNAPPGSCYTSSMFPNWTVLTNTQLPYCHNLNVNVHHNAVMLNASTGDELFSATPAGAGGVNFTPGSDKYQFQYNWVCGNLSTGDGGGFGHLGFTWNGDIEHNWILFNQSTNPTISTNGGGILIYGAPDVDPPCGATTDVDCLAPAGSIGPSDGTGPNLVINANLIMGNAAESGSGGGLRLHNINGSEVINFPMTPSQWYAPRVTNNIIVNNVAGWDGGGISLQDALAANIVNNTIMSNDTTASAGVLFNTLGAPLASAQGPCPVARNPDGTCPVPVTTSTPQAAGLVTIQNSAVLTANMAPLRVNCPAGHFAGTSAINGTCKSYSYPLLYNNIFWQNRTFYIGVGALGGGTLNQQNVVTLFDGFTTAHPASQGSTGACSDSNSHYWDIGVRGDTGPGNHSSGVTLAPRFSVLTNTGASSENGSGSNNLLGSNPAVISQYCNGSRVPPELCAPGNVPPGTVCTPGYDVPPGISDATVPNPIFSLTPSATVDEGNNWVNISWGPLSELNPVTGATLGNYAIPSTSPASTAGTSSAQSGVTPPNMDFFGNARTVPYAIGAVEPGAGASVSSASVTPTTLAFGNWATGTTSTAQTVTVTNTGNTALGGGTFTVVGGAPFSRPGGAAGGTCGATMAIGASCTINVVFAPTAVASYSRTLTIAYTGATVTGTPVTLTGAGVNMAVTPASLSFGDVGVSTTSAAQTLTVRNSTGSTRSLTIVVTAPFSRPAGAAGGTCGATLANGTTCTINVVFASTALGPFTGTVAVTTNGGFTVANSPVALSGNAVAQVIAANLTPTIWSPQQTRNCPIPPGQCNADPVQLFTLTNAGNVTLTLNNQATLGGANAADYLIVRALSTCGPAGGGQVLGITTLAPGATCAVTVQFRPLTAEAPGTKNATVSVTDSAGTQTSTLAGLAQ